MFLDVFLDFVNVFLSNYGYKVIIYCFICICMMNFVLYFFFCFILDWWIVMKILREKFFVWCYINGLLIDMVVWLIVLCKFLSFIDFVIFFNFLVLSKFFFFFDYEYIVVIGIYKCI